MPRRWATAFVLVTIGWGTTPSGAALLTLGAAKDNTLYQDPAGTISNGLGNFFFAGVTAQGLSRRGLIAFDVAGSLPAGSTITAVTLTLHVSQTSSGAHVTGLHRVLQDWGEGASMGTLTESTGAPAAAGDATWAHTFFPDQFWSTPGGDFDPAATAAALIAGIGFYQWSSTGMVADVQQWLDQPGLNFGWLLLGNESSLQTTKRFDSRQNPDLAFRPVLAIEYQPIPSAGAIWMLINIGRGRRPRARCSDV